MKKILNFIKKNKRIIITLSILVTVIAITLLLTTYAYLSWSSLDKPSNNTTVNINISDFVDVEFKGGSDIDGLLYPVLDYKEGLSSTFTVTNRKNIDSSNMYSVSFNLDSVPVELLNESIKYKLFKDNIEVANGSLKDHRVNDKIILYKTGVDLNTVTYKFYLYLDGTIENNREIIGKRITAKISAEKYFMSLAEKITYLYNENVDKSNTVKNGKEGKKVEYYYAPSVSLMNDRLGGTETLASGIGNIRYYGATPNNYILLGDDKVNDMYRIIGLFKNVELANGTHKDLVKVIKNDFIGDYSWDTSVSSVNSGNGVNQWGPSAYSNGNLYEGADLMRLLNPGYDGINGSLWWDSASGNCYDGQNDVKIACNFTSTGLNPSIQSKIESVTWHMGGFASNKIYSDDGYIKERGDEVGSLLSDKINRMSTWTGKVALMSPSDYGYAGNFNSCFGNLYSYDNSACQNNNWLYIQDKYQWLLAPNFSSAYFVYYVTSSGYVNYNNRNTYRDLGVRPVFYLDSELSIATGDGSSGTPYEIK